MGGGGEVKPLRATRLSEDASPYPQRMSMSGSVKVVRFVGLAQPVELLERITGPR